MLKARPSDGHKGTFGTVGIIGGSSGNPGGTDNLHPRMIGAPSLAAMGANRAGCGLVKIGAPEPILNAILTLAPMATGYPIGVTLSGELISSDAEAVLDRLATESDTLVIGPGLGTGDEIEQLVLRAVAYKPSGRCRCLVVDADGINALCKAPDFVKSIEMPLILTPHPGEALRLLRALQLDGTPDGTHEQRVQVCATLADALGSIVVLKGQGTVVSDGQRSWTCEHGHPCLAAGGTGDVLAGMTGSLAAQCVNDSEVDLFVSTCIAVDAHAVSGQHWASTMDAQAGLDPSQLCDHIACAMSTHRIPPPPPANNSPQ